MMMTQEQAKQLTDEWLERREETLTKSRIFRDELIKKADSCDTPLALQLSAEIREWNKFLFTANALRGEC